MLLAQAVGGMLMRLVRNADATNGKGEVRRAEATKRNGGFFQPCNRLLLWVVDIAAPMRWDVVVVNHVFFVKERRR